jgi:Domain of unknown function (DUF1963)
MPDRRGFFKDVLREVLGAVEGLGSALESLDEPDPWHPPLPRPAAPAVGFVDGDQLEELVRAAGLEHRLTDLRSLVRAGVRLTPAGESPTRSRLGGSPELPADFAWPSWNGRELAFLGQLDLAEATSAGVGGPLSEAGLLLVFADLKGRPSGLSPGHAGSCSVVLVPPGSELTEDRRNPVLRELPVRPTRELQLPNAWSFHAEPLALSPEEIEPWEEVRTKLAELQGVDPEEEAFGRIALHRLLGYQDEIGRELEIDCQLASAGIDADDELIYFESRVEHETEARNWRLLLQVTADATLRLGDGVERLFVCMREDDLRERRLDRAWALVR